MSGNDETRFLRTTPRQARSEETVAKLLTAAGELFGEVGVGGATTTEIARRADVAIGSMYHFFPGKREMALALATQYVEEMVAVLADVATEFEGIEHLEPFVAKMVENAHDVFLSHPGYYAALRYSTTIEERSPLDQLRVEVTRIITGLYAQAGFTDVTPENGDRVAFFTIEIVRLMLEDAPTEATQLTAYRNELTRVVVAYLSSFLTPQA